MAGGIDWFRWHHGTVDEAKLRTAARRAGARMCEAVAMWAICMETASKAESRGSCAGLDFEVIDCTQEFEEGTAQRLYAAFQGLARPLVDADDGLIAWDKRQPKREREDLGAADRQRAKRERDAAQVTDQVNVTPRHATSHQKTPREEKRREEDSLAPSVLVLDAAAPEDDGPKAYEVPDCPHVELVEVYHEALPTLPRCEVLNDTRRGYMRQRWREVCAEFKLSKAEGIEWWRGYFATVAGSTFLTGRSPPGRDGRQPFRADLEWLTRPNNFAKVVEGRYSGARQ